MNLLAIDTSGPVCGVAVMKDDKITCEYTVTNKMTHSVNLLPMIDAALTQSGIKLENCDRIAVVSGPGSFTGVRIGISTVKGLAHGTNLPCTPVDALEAMAAGIQSFSGTVCPIQDARAGQVYGAAFAVQDGMPERLMEDQPIRLEDFIDQLKALPAPYLFLGDGMPVHRAKLTELLQNDALFAPPNLAYLRPSSAAVIAAASSTEVSYQELMPMYLRAPNAERNKKLVEAAANG